MVARRSGPPQKDGRQRTVGENSGRVEAYGRRHEKLCNPQYHLFEYAAEEAREGKEGKLIQRSKANGADAMKNNASAAGALDAGISKIAF